MEYPTDQKDEVPYEIRMNYEDYCRLPDDGKRYEIVDGVVHNAPAPSRIHQDVSRNLGFLLVQHVDAGDLGKIYYAPIDVVFSHENIVQPDIIFVRKKRFSILTDKNIKGAPDLVIEILSPGRKDYDRVTKAKTYALYGVPHYWIVDPEPQSIRALVLREGRYECDRVWKDGDILTTELFPDLTLDLIKVFE